jgi:hypothetical protein
VEWINLVQDDKDGPDVLEKRREENREACKKKGKEGKENSLVPYRKLNLGLPFW